MAGKRGQYTAYDGDQVAKWKAAIATSRRQQRSRRGRRKQGASRVAGPGMVRMRPAQDVPANQGGGAQEENTLEQGSVVVHLGGWDQRGRVLATFELADSDLTAWQLHRVLTGGAYAVVQWDRGAEPAVVPVTKLQEISED